VIGLKAALVAGVAAISLATFAAQAWRITLLKRDNTALAAAEQSASQAAGAWQRTTEAERRERAKERGQADNTRKVLDEERERTAAALAAADRAAAAGERLRAAAERAASACRGAVPAHPSGAASDPPAADPGMVLADVLGRARARLQDLGKFADQRGAAGGACNAERDTLTTKE